MSGQAAGDRPTRPRPLADCLDPGGFALLVVLLALLVLTGVLHATLMLARFQGLAFRAESRALQARIGAQSGVRWVASDVTGTDLSSLVSPDSVLVRPLLLGTETRATVSIRRLAPEWLWIEGDGRAGMGVGQGVRRMGAAYWSLEPEARVRALLATVEVEGSVTVPASSSITPLVGGASDPGRSEGACDGSVAGTPPPTLLSGGSRPATATQGGGSVSGPVPTLGGIPRLGLLDGAALADRWRSNPGAPGPDPAAGTAAGASTGPAGRVPEAAELRLVEGSFDVPDEGFRGVLAVDGDLVVPPGREIQGLALVGGSVSVEEGARLLGAARVGGSVSVRGSGSILGSPCVVLEVLGDLPALSRPLPAPAGTWMSLP